jgi:hypothetical protein
MRRRQHGAAFYIASTHYNHLSDSMNLSLQ